MTTLSLLQYLLGAGAGVLVGLSLGMVGGGGSILAVPLLAYLVGVKDPHVAIGTSAVAVAANAAVNLVNHARVGNVKWRCAALFSLAGVSGAWLGSTLGKGFDGQRLLALFALFGADWAAMLGMVEYSAAHNAYLATAFPKRDIRNSLGEWVAAHGLRQFRLAETEKYPHVTFFLNGGREAAFPGEDRAMPNSPKVATYDLQPAPNLTTVAAPVKVLQYDYFIYTSASESDANVDGGGPKHQVRNDFSNACEEHTAIPFLLILTNSPSSIIAALFSI